MVSGRFEETWHSRYERWANQHDAEHHIAGWSEQGLARRLALVLLALGDTDLKRGSKVLDLGAGPGTYTRALTARGHRCLGLDYSLNVVKIAKSKDTNGDYLQGEAYYLPFKSGSFDAVLCVGVLQSLESPKEAILEIRRILKPRGYLLLDGLNSLFWLHSVRNWRARINGAEKRMSYYDPFEVVKEMRQSGLDQAQIRWLSMPQIFQTFLGENGKYNGHWVARLFGYAFLILARNQA